MKTAEPLEWKTVKRRIADLIPFEFNPRKMSIKERSDLVASLNKFDLVEIPVIDLDNTLIAGHQRVGILMAAGKGDQEIDVRIPNRKLTPDEFKEYNVRSNRQAGAFDENILHAHFSFEQLTEWGFQAMELPNNFGYDQAATNEGRTVRSNKIGFSYRLEFDNESQLENFNNFIGLIKQKYPDEQFISTRIIKFIEENG